MHNKLLIPFFCTIITITLLADVLIPDKYYSSSEKRKLTQISEISVSDFPKGTMGTKFENYLADQFPLRDALISVKTITELMSGKTEISGVYFCKNGYLINKFTSISKTQLNLNLKALVNFSEKLKNNNVSFQIMLVPTAAYILSDYLPDFAPNISQETLIDAAKNAGLSVINPCSELFAHKDEYIYYKTDHHFTSLGAYYCYRAWRNFNNITPEDLSSWQEETLSENFRGTTYNKVNCPFSEYDTITAYYKNKNHTVNYNNGYYITDTIYESKYLDTADKYAVFLNSNQAQTVITGSGTGKLLIIKDSYANCFTQFVIDDYAETHLIDLRFFNSSVYDYISENKITEVLVLYNIPNFAEDSAIGSKLN